MDYRTGGKRGFMIASSVIREHLNGFQIISTTIRPNGKEKNSGRNEHFRIGSPAIPTTGTTT
jgi:hypothetical protein